MCLLHDVTSVGRERCADHTLHLVPLLLIRHAWAGSRETWQGDDRLRPLDERGRRQAAGLVELLADQPVARLLTSSYLRCVQTVEPLAAARGLRVELREELGEDRQGTDGAALVRALAGDDVAVCGHGGLEWVIDRPPKWKKGAVLVLDERLRVVEVRRP
jgi:phosphohistidine phosphatase SixA